MLLEITFAIKTPFHYYNTFYFSVECINLKSFLLPSSVSEIKWFYLDMLIWRNLINTWYVRLSSDSWLTPKFETSKMIRKCKFGTTSTYLKCITYFNWSKNKISRLFFRNWIFEAIWFSDRNFSLNWTY